MVFRFSYIICFYSLLATISAAGSSAPANNHIKTPFAGENVTLDSDFLISWDELANSSVSLFLLKTNETTAAIQSNIANTGGYWWHVNASLLPGNDYAILLSVDNISQSLSSDFSIVRQVNLTSSLGGVNTSSVSPGSPGGSTPIAGPTTSPIGTNIPTGNGNLKGKLIGGILGGVLGLLLLSVALTLFFARRRRSRSGGSAKQHGVCHEIYLAPKLQHQDFVISQSHLLHDLDSLRSEYPDVIRRQRSPGIPQPLSATSRLDGFQKNIVQLSGTRDKYSDDSSSSVKNIPANASRIVQSDLSRRNAKRWRVKEQSDESSEIMQPNFVSHRPPPQCQVEEGNNENVSQSPITFRLPDLSDDASSSGLFLSIPMRADGLYGKLLENALNFYFMLRAFPGIQGFGVGLDLLPLSGVPTSWKGNRETLWLQYSSESGSFDTVLKALKIIGRYVKPHPIIAVNLGSGEPGLIVIDYDSDDENFGSSQATRTHTAGSNMDAGGNQTGESGGEYSFQQESGDSGNSPPTDGSQMGSEGDSGDLGQHGGGRGSGDSSQSNPQDAEPGKSSKKFEGQLLISLPGDSSQSLKIAFDLRIVPRSSPGTNSTQCNITIDPLRVMATAVSLRDPTRPTYRPDKIRAEENNNPNHLYLIHAVDLVINPVGGNCQIPREIYPRKEIFVTGFSTSEDKGVHGSVQWSRSPGLNIGIFKKVGLKQDLDPRRHHLELRDETGSNDGGYRWKYILKQMANKTLQELPSPNEGHTLTTEFDPDTAPNAVEAKVEVIFELNGKFKMETLKRGDASYRKWLGRNVNVKHIVLRLSTQIPNENDDGCRYPKVDDTVNGCRLKLEMKWEEGRFVEKFRNEGNQEELTSSPSSLGSPDSPIGQAGFAQIQVRQAGVRPNN